MIHLDSVEKSASRINEYLHDPEAWGGEIRTGRRERLEKLCDSLCDSAKILCDKLERTRGLAEIDIDAVIDRAVLRALSTMNAQQIQTQSVPGISTNAESASDVPKSSESKKRKTDSRVMSKSNCGKVYRLYSRVIAKATTVKCDSAVATDFTRFISDYYYFRIHRSSPFKSRCNVFHVADFIERLFIAYAGSTYLDQFNHFHNKYLKWESDIRQSAESDKGYQVPSAVIDYAHADGMTPEMVDYIRGIWEELIDGPFREISRMGNSDPAIEDALLWSNPFRTWDVLESTEKGDAAVTL